MLRPQPLPPVPDATARVARAAFPKGHPDLAAADALGEVFADAAFAVRAPRRGQPALAPWRLALATALRFAEGLSDRQAADAVRARLDWEDVLRRDLDDPGFDAAVLCAFRRRLAGGGAGWLLFETLAAWARTRRLLKARGRQRTDATHVLAAVRARNRLAVVGETPRHALDGPAVAAPAWLRARCRPDWGDRYGRRPEGAALPRGQAARAAFALRVGGDGHALLAAIWRPDAPAWPRAIPAVGTVRRVWVRQFRLRDGMARWRVADDIPPAAISSGSPDDEDAHDARKGTTSWVGDTSHLTEACDDDLPRLSTHVETTTAPVVDAAVSPPIHAARRGRDLLPAVQRVDSGDRDAPQLVAAQEDDAVALRGPARPDDRWQARAERLRARRLPARPGAGAGDLPGGAGERQLAAAPGSRRATADLGQVLERGLRALPEPTRVLPRHGSLAPADPLSAPARPVRGAPGRPPARVDRRARRDLRAPRRDRGHARPRHPALPPAPHALSRPAAGPARPQPRRDRPHLPPPRGMVARRVATAATSPPLARLLAEPVAA